MKVSQISCTNFMAGSVRLNNINVDKLHTFDAIKKLADDKNLNISILHNKDSELLFNEHFYTVTAKNITEDLSKLKCGIASTFISKKVCAEEASVKIFNTAINAIEMLEKKLA